MSEPPPLEPWYLGERCLRTWALFEWACGQAADLIAPSADDDPIVVADVQLANALLDAEWTLHRWQTARQWRALERLLPLIPPGGTYDEVLHLPTDDRLHAVRAIVTLGWHRAVEGSDG